jgi:hypothetical protein
MTRQELTVHVAQTLNNPWAGSTVFLCALLLAGAIAAAVTAPARAPKGDAQSSLPLASTLTVEDRRLLPPLEPPDTIAREDGRKRPDEPATFAQRWDAMHPEFETGRVEIVDAVTPPVLGFEPPLAAPPRERRRLAESEQELVTPPKMGTVTKQRTREPREPRDVCGRHGLSKTWVSSRRWRCR